MGRMAAIFTLLFTQLATERASVKNLQFDGHLQTPFKTHCFSKDWINRNGVFPACTIHNVTVLVSDTDTPSCESSIKTACINKTRKGMIMKEHLSTISGWPGYLSSVWICKVELPDKLSGCCCNSRRIGHLFVEDNIISRMPKFLEKDTK